MDSRKNNLNFKERANSSFQRHLGPVIGYLRSPYSLFEFFSLLILAACIAFGFCPLILKLPHIDKALDPFEIATSLLPLAVTITSLLLGTPNDKIAGLDRPTFLRLLPTHYPAGKRPLAFFIGFYLLMLAAFELDAFCSEFDPLAYRAIAPLSSLIFVAWILYANLSLLLKRNKTILHILAAHANELDEEAYPLLSNLNDLQVAIENMIEAVGISETFNVLLKRFQKGRGKASKDPRLALLISILQMKILMAKKNLDLTENNSGQKGDMLSFTRHCIQDIEEIVGDSDHFPLNRMLRSKSDVFTFSMRLARIVFLLRKLGLRLGLQDEIEELVNFVGSVGRNGLDAEFGNDKLAILIAELHFVTDGLHEKGKLDIWFWNLLRSSIPDRMAENYVYLFLCMFIFYVKDDKNIPEETHRKIDGFLKDKVIGPVSTSEDFVDTLRYPIQCITESQRKCLQILKIIFKVFESTDSFGLFLYSPQKTQVFPDYAHLNLDTALDCWMEIFAWVRVSDEKALLDEIVRIISDGVEKNRVNSFMAALERTFDREGQIISDQPFNCFLRWSIETPYRTNGTMNEIVMSLFRKYGSLNSSDTNEGSINRHDDEALNKCRVIVNDIAIKLVKEAKSQLGPTLVKKEVIRTKIKKSEFLSTLNVYELMTFQDKTFKEYLFNEMTGQILQCISNQTSKDLDLFFEGKPKTTEAVCSYLSRNSKLNYSFCTRLDLRHELGKAIMERFPSIKELPELDIFSDGEDLVDRIILFNKGDIEVSVWVDWDNTICRYPNDEETAYYLKNRFSMKNGRFYMPSSFKKSSYALATVDDSVKRWKNRLVVFQVVIGYAVSIKKENCLFLEAPFTLD